MEAKKYPYRNVQEYLDHLGMLEHGTAEEIEFARRNFRSIYLKNYRKSYKQFHPTVSVSFRKKDKLVLIEHAQQNGMKLASFIQQLALDYLFRGKNAGTKPSVNYIEAKKLFEHCYDLVEELHFENESSELNISYQRLLELFATIDNLLTS